MDPYLNVTDPDYHLSSVLCTLYSNLFACMIKGLCIPASVAFCVDTTCGVMLMSGISSVVHKILRTRNDRLTHLISAHLFFECLCH